MPTEPGEAGWVSEAHEFSLAELAELSGLSATELHELVEFGAVAPLRPEATPWIFGGHCLVTVRTAFRLRQSFELEPHGIALAMALLQRVSDLEAQLQHLQARLPQSTV